MRKFALLTTLATVALAMCLSAPDSQAAAANVYKVSAVSQQADTTSLTLQFNGVTLLRNHQLSARLIDKATRREAARAVVDTVAADTLQVVFSPVEQGGSYWVEIFSDQNDNQVYDGVSPDLSWRIPVNTIAGPATIEVPLDLSTTELDWRYLLSLNLEGAEPLVGQRVVLRLEEVSTGREVYRAEIDSVAIEDITAEIGALEEGMNYWLDIWADLDRDGFYDGVPGDQSWRFSVSGVEGDVSLDIPYTTTFTQLDWPYLLTLNMEDMPLDVGERMEFRLVETTGDREVSRAVVDSVVVGDFPVYLSGLEFGNDYRVDMWADINENGVYDGIPTDHSWQLTLNDAAGDTTVTFMHNTDFVEVEWPYLLTLDLQGMGPNIGDAMRFRVVRADTNVVVSSASIDSVRTGNVSVLLPGIMPDADYRILVFADANDNGRYDPPPTDQAWLIELDDAAGDTTIVFTRNDDFVDIGWTDMATLRLTGMTPEIGNTMWFRLIDETLDRETARTMVDSVAAAEFEVDLAGITPGNDYRIEFFSDVDGNNLYDAPPADHAWAVSFADAFGDTTVVFDYTTTYTDIGWTYAVTLDLRDMAPNEDALMEFRVVNESDDSEVYRTRVSPVAAEEFQVTLPGIVPGNTYRIDFYADANGNRQYDAPPADQAWRISGVTTSADTMVIFTRTTDFVDIEWPGQVAVEEEIPAVFALHQNAPNPFNPSTSIAFEMPAASPVKLEIFNIAGQRVRTLVDRRLDAGAHTITWDGRDDRGLTLSSGVYFYRLRTATMQKTMRMMLLK